jgi:hypothetical protein
MSSSANPASAPPSASDGRFQRLAAYGWVDAVAIEDVTAVRGARSGVRLPEDDVARLDTAVDVHDVVIAHLSVRGLAEIVGVDVREMGDVEEVLDDAWTRGVQQLGSDGRDVDHSLVPERKRRDVPR